MPLLCETLGFSSATFGLSNSCIRSCLVSARISNKGCCNPRHNEAHSQLIKVDSKLLSSEDPLHYIPLCGQFAVRTRSLTWDCKIRNTKLSYQGTRNVAIQALSSDKFLGAGKYAGVKDLTNIISE